VAHVLGGRTGWGTRRLNALRGGALCLLARSLAACAALAKELRRRLHRLHRTFPVPAAGFFAKLVEMRPPSSTLCQQSGGGNSGSVPTNSRSWWLKVHWMRCSVVAPTLRGGVAPCCTKCAALGQRACSTRAAGTSTARAHGSGGRPWG
jgi:hypothetical protein